MQQRFSLLAERLKAFGRPVLVLDLESTGGDLHRDRITEIAFLRFDGGSVRAVQSLVNPQQPVPPFISKLTGISDDTVADAPLFAELLPRLLPELHGGLLIAHNSYFDHTLLVNECRRLGIHFVMPALCSVKLSQALYPAADKHSLDAVAARFGIAADAYGRRHRAMTDVLILSEFLQQTIREHDAVWLQTAHTLIHPPLPPHGLPETLQNSLNSLPDRCGVTVWHHGSRTAQAYACNNAYADSVRRLHSLSAEHRQDTAHIDFLPSLGSLHSHFIRARYLHQAGLNEAVVPLNRHAVSLYEEQGCLKVRVRPLYSGFYSEPPCAVFRHGKAAQKALSEWAAAYQICPVQSGIEPPSAAMLPQETALHNRRIRTALPYLSGSSDSICSKRFTVTETDPFDGSRISLCCEHGALKLDENLWYLSEDVWEVLKIKLKSARQHIREQTPPALHSAFAALHTQKSVKGKRKK